ncbi:MAG: 23S rRNA pseudouridine1911/1915/1917 synthase [Myxococcota bacterium]|jgi:23S rRNA pseudouridine1911/1915/1917 synthase
MRLDRFLSRRFADRSRTWFARGIRDGQVRDAADRPLRSSTRVRAGDWLRLYLPGIAPDGPPPPHPAVLHEDARVIVIDKPAGLLAHPAGTDFTWSVIGLAKERWAGETIDLVHRLDRDTSGVLVLTRDAEANRVLKAALKAGEVHKEYEALARGSVEWDTRSLTGPIGSAGGVIRIQMAVCDDGLAARTDVTVLGRQPSMTHVRCVLHTGRTHQIRVHMHHAGHSLVGDRMYGVAPEVFLRTLDHGPDAQVVEAAGAPRHALHAARIRFRHPDGHTVQVEAPTPADMGRWWQHPVVLPHDTATP